MDLPEKGIYTVHELTLCIKGILTSDARLLDVWVRGEISNLTNHSSGHRYFTLKDKTSQVSCVMFKWHGQRLRFEIERGMKVLVFGDIDVYEPKGQYQFRVRDVRPDGVGELYTAFLQLKNRLESEGLFSEAHKRPLPQFPKRIGIVASPTGAVIHDIITVTGRRYPVDILLVPTTVQGDQAAPDIVRSINLLNRTDVDVIILARGGGSIEDLWAFNEEPVARAIHSSRVPVVSAVGHETDFTIADFVADRRAPTPSAAAELVVPDRVELRQRVIENETRLIECAERMIENRKEKLTRISESIDPGDLIKRLEEYEQHLDDLFERMKNRMTHFIENKKTLFNVRVEQLDSVSPVRIINRGYSIAVKLPERSLIKAVNDVVSGDDLEITVRDGAIKCVVEEIYDRKSRLTGKDI